MKLSHYQYVDAENAIWHLILDSSRLRSFPDTQSDLDWLPSASCLPQQVDQFRTDVQNFGYAVFRLEASEAQTEDATPEPPLHSLDAGDADSAP